MYKIVAYTDGNNILSIHRFANTVDAAKHVESSEGVAHALVLSESIHYDKTPGKVKTLMALYICEEDPIIEGLIKEEFRIAAWNRMSAEQQEDYGCGYYR